MAMTAQKTFHGLEPDRFQLQAFESIDNNQSVFVTAPTGAGKTLIAEYAIEKALSDHRRVIYTSPLKALSNQKFREFQAKYGVENVGIVTGDVSHQPYANIVVMTTEILRNFLYGHEEGEEDLIFDVSWVIFDEIHYIMDPLRGMVWEEALMLLPPEIRVVCLSATVGNAQEFGEWLSTVREERVRVIMEHKRPVPLANYLFWGAGHPLLKVPPVEEPLPTEIESLLDQEQDEIKLTKKDFQFLIHYLDENDLLPALLFVFSRKGTERAINLLIDLDVDLLDDVKERATIFEELTKFELSLPEDVRRLKQLLDLKLFLTRGMAVHHAGLLPRVKEFIESLHERGFIKLMACTETFALGINNPVKTVVFFGVHKYDGQEFRILSPSEYAQMAGRAGRRGMDKEGVSIIYCDGITLVDAVNLIRGKIEDLQSQIRPTYSMIINLFPTYGKEGLMYILQESFGSYMDQRRRKEIQRRRQQEIAELTKKLEETKFSCLYPIDMSPSIFVKKYLNLQDEIKRQQQRINRFHDRFKSIIRDLEKMLPLGRVFRDYFGKIGVILEENFDPMIFDPIASSMLVYHEDKTFCRMALQEISAYSSIRMSPRELRQVLPLSELAREKDPLVLQEAFENLNEVAKAFFSVKFDELKEKSISRSDWTPFEPKLRQLLAKVEPHLNDYKKQVEKMEQLVENRDKHLCHGCKELENHSRLVVTQKHLLERLYEIQNQQDEVVESRIRYLDSIISVLKFFGFLTNDGHITPKGALMKLIFNENNMIIAEILHGGVLDNLNVEEKAAVLSVFVFESRYPRGKWVRKKLGDRLYGIYRDIVRLERQISRKEEKLGIPRDFSSRPLSSQLMVPTLRWAKGYSLVDAIRGSKVSEGDFIRGMRRLVDLCRQIARSPSYSADMVEIIDRIWRDEVVPPIFGSLEEEKNR